MSIKKTILSTMLIVMLSFPILGQYALQLQYFKHIKRERGDLPNGSFGWHKAFVNENGWMFLLSPVRGAFQFEDINIQGEEDSVSGSILIAFDNKGKKRWHHYTDSSVGGGPTLILGAWGDNGVVTYYGVAFSDFLHLPGHKRINFPSGTKDGLVHYDSMGNIDKIKLYELEEKLGLGSGSFPFQGNLVSASYYDETVTMYDCDLNVLHHHKVRADYASVILDAAGNCYFLVDIGAKRSEKVKGKTYTNDTDTAAWLLFKYNAQNQLQWYKRFNTGKGFEINDNKMLRINKRNELFVALPFMVDFEVDGNLLVAYASGPVGKQKTAILRLDAADGKLLSAHYDPETAHSLNEVRQVVWLENDKNDEVYAYLYVEGLLDSFDQIGFDSIRKYPSRIIHWNAQTSHSDRAYANQSGRREISVLPNRQVFWTFHMFTDLTNWVE